MPLYEYQCAKCGKKFEEINTSSDKKETPTCPRCGSTKVERQMSVFSSCGSSDGEGCGGGSGGLAPPRRGGG